jgi:hypothetical protein
LIKAHEFSKTLNGDLYIPSRDLALLASEQQLYAMAAKYYEQAKKEMESKRHHVADAYRYAVILKELAVIEKNLGNNAASAKYLSKAESIFKTVEKSEVYTTPFGAYCKSP